MRKIEKIVFFTFFTCFFLLVIIWFLWKTVKMCQNCVKSVIFGKMAKNGQKWGVGPTNSSKMSVFWVKNVDFSWKKHEKFYFSVYVKNCTILAMFFKFYIFTCFKVVGGQFHRFGKNCLFLKNPIMWCLYKFSHFCKKWKFFEKKIFFFIFFEKKIFFLKNCQKMHFCIKITIAHYGPREGGQKWEFFDKIAKKVWKNRKKQ